MFVRYNHDLIIFDLEVSVVGINDCVSLNCVAQLNIIGICKFGFVILILGNGMDKFCI
ncbi:hypothetical protein Hanom_Chr16g01473981 [Helianthus anomalus]